MHPQEHDKVTENSLSAAGVEVPIEDASFCFEGMEGAKQGEVDGVEEFLSECHVGDIDHGEEDHSYSVLSNCFFFAGGVAYLALSLWDSNTQIPLARALLFNNILAALGAFLYLFDSVIDIRWALVVQARQKQEFRVQGLIVITPMDNDAYVDDSEDDLVFNKNKTMNENETLFPPAQKHSCQSYALPSALCFGIASFLAVLDWCVASLDMPPLLPFYSLSTHAYFVSALFAVSGKRRQPWWGTFSLRNADMLENLGDLFFMVGSVMDVMLCDLHFGDDIYQWDIFSSFLWCFDACLYLWSDAMFTGEYDNRSIPTNSGVISQ